MAYRTWQELPGCALDKENRVNRAIIIAIGASVALAGCASDRAERRAATRGALIGAAGGAALSAIAGGDAAQGAAIGAAAGAAIGYITHDGKRREVYRGSDGRDYWFDDRGRRRRR